MSVLDTRAGLEECETLVRLAGRALAEHDPGASADARELKERLDASPLSRYALAQLWLTTLASNGATTTEMYLWADQIRAQRGRKRTWTNL